MQLDDVFWPETSATGPAREVVAAYSSPALTNHCVRSYIWAASYAQLHDIAHDA